MHFHLIDNYAKPSPEQTSSSWARLSDFEHILPSKIVGISTSVTMKFVLWIFALLCAGLPIGKSTGRVFDTSTLLGYYRIWGCDYPLLSARAVDTQWNISLFLYSRNVQTVMMMMMKRERPLAASYRSGQTLRHSATWANNKNKQTMIGFTAIWLTFVWFKLLSGRGGSCLFVSARYDTYLATKTEDIPAKIRRASWIALGKGVLIDNYYSEKREM